CVAGTRRCRPADRCVVGELTDNAAASGQASHRTVTTATDEGTRRNEPAGHGRRAGSPVPEPCDRGRGHAGPPVPEPGHGRGRRRRRGRPHQDVVTRRTTKERTP